MITNFLMDHRELLPVLFLGIAVVCAGAGYLALRARHGQRILWGLVALSLVPVFALTLNPVLGRSFVICVVQFSLPTLRTVELLANVALFIAPVFFATVATRRPLLVLAAGIGLSALLEAIQAAIPAIGRACDTNDLAMNTIGAVLGVLLGVGTIALSKRRPSPPA